MSITVIIPIADGPALNAALDELGHGPSNLSLEFRLKPGTGGATHLAAHCWPDSRFLADVESLKATFPKLEAITEFIETDAAGNKHRATGVLFDRITKAKGLERMPKPDATI